MAGLPVEHFRVVSDHNGHTWELQEIRPDDEELPPSYSWLVFTPRQGMTKRIPAPDGTLTRLSVEELRRELVQAKEGVFA